MTTVKLVVMVFGVVVLILQLKIIVVCVMEEMLILKIGLLLVEAVVVDQVPSVGMQEHGNMVVEVEVDTLME